LDWAEQYRQFSILLESARLASAGWFVELVSLLSWFLCWITFRRPGVTINFGFCGLQIGLDD
jgi:hypothetical protein